MKKEKIIDLVANELIDSIGRDMVDRFEEDKKGNLKISLISLQAVAEHISEMLFDEIEQEKREQVREILDKIKNCSCLIVHGCNHRCWLEDTIKTIAEEYGVKL